MYVNRLPPRPRQAPLLTARAVAVGPIYASMPEPVRGPLDESIVKLSKIEGEAKSVLASGKGRVSADLKSLTADLAKLRSSTALVTNMTALMARAGAAV